MSDFIDEIISAQIARHSLLLERECEVAIEGGMYGVSVIADGLVTTVGVNPVVPYGHVYEFPSRDSYDAYLERRYTDDSE